MFSFETRRWRPFAGFRRFLLRHRLAHEEIEGLLDTAVEYLVGAAFRVLKLRDIEMVAVPLAQKSDRIACRSRGVRRVDADHACDTGWMPQRHLPDDKPAPVVADKDRLVDVEMI